MVAVLRLPDRVEMLNPLAPAETREHLDLFRPPVRRNDQEDVPAHRFGRRVPEQPLGAPIP